MKAAPIVLDMAAIYQGLIITLASALVVYFARQISKTVSENLSRHGSKMRKHAEH